MNNRKNFAIKRQNKSVKYGRIVTIALMGILGDTSTLHASKRNLSDAFSDTMSPEEMWFKRSKFLEEDHYYSSVHRGDACLDGFNSDDTGFFESFHEPSDPFGISLPSMSETNSSFETSFENLLDSQFSEVTTAEETKVPVKIGQNDEGIYDLERLVEESIEATSLSSRIDPNVSFEVLSENPSKSPIAKRAQNTDQQTNALVEIGQNGGGVINLGKIIDQEEMEVALVKRNAHNTRGTGFFKYLTHEIMSEEREVILSNKLSQWYESNVESNQRSLLRGYGFTIQGGVITQLRKHVAVVPLTRK